MGSNVSVTTKVSGLDSSWWYLTVKAAQYDQIQNNGFIGTYGPFGFLDFSLTTWKTGLILNFLYRIIITVLLYKILYTLFQKNFNFKNQIVGLITFISTLVANYFLPPSQVLVVGLLVFWASSKTSESWQLNGLGVLILGSLSSFLFLVKVLPGTLAATISISIITQGIYSNSLKDISAKLKLFCVFIISFAGSFFVFLIFLGFSLNQIPKWLFAYWQMTSGYKAMSFEETGRIWEYTAFLILILILFYSIRSTYSNILTFIADSAFVYCLFLYGFNRHDAHAITTFSFLAAMFFVMFLNRNTIRDLFQLAFAIVLLISVSGFNLVQLFDVSPKLNNFLTYVKLLESDYSIQLVNSNTVALQGSYPISAAMLDVIGKETVSIYPWDQIAGAAWDLNLESPPAAQLFTAYTPWLDQQNVNWLNSKKASKFMLWTPPKSIDGRNPHWDSPKFQFEVLCNYSPLIHDTNWVLLERRPSNVCGQAKFTKSITLTSETDIGNLFVPTSANSIITINISQNQSLVQKAFRTVFKPLRTDTVKINGLEVRFVWSTKENLVISVPSSMDYPAPYSYGQNFQISGLNKAVISVYETPIKDFSK
jgi:hypothetical protein